jgi:serine/threonine protein kinase
MDRVPPEREWYVIEMEYFPSDTLARLLDEGDQGFVRSYAKLLSLYLQVLDGVRYLHNHGMSHGGSRKGDCHVFGGWLSKLGNLPPRSASYSSSVYVFLRGALSRASAWAECGFKA